MPEINELPALAPADVSDEDIIPAWSAAAPSGSKARGVTRAGLLSGVPRTDGDATFAVVEADEVNAQTGAIDELTVGVGLEIGGTLSKMVKGDISITISTLASLASETQTVTVTGALVGDFVVIRTPSGLPAGLVLIPSISATNTLQIRATNCSGGSIAGATYSMSVLALRMA